MNGSPAKEIGSTWRFDVQEGRNYKIDFQYTVELRSNGSAFSIIPFITDNYHRFSVSSFSSSSFLSSG